MQHTLLLYSPVFHMPCVDHRGLRVFCLPGNGLYIFSLFHIDPSGVIVCTREKNMKNT